MIYSSASQKGGVGKTSTSISIAAGLAHKGKKVLLVDVDSQANSSKVLLHDYKTIRPEETVYRTIIKREPLAIYPSSIPGLDVVPSHILLAETDTSLASATDHREARLKRELDKVKGNYDSIILDCPPSLGWLTLNAFTASDYIIIVVEPGYFELDSITQIIRTIKAVQSDFNPDLVVRGILLNKSDQTLATTESVNLLQQMYPDLLLPIIIPRNTDVKNAHYQKEDIFTYNAKASAALAYEKLVQEVFL
jgi:chromosome partitioning protein